MENDLKFNLDEIERTFTKYDTKKIVDAIVVQKRDDGAVVNIGGKKDAFIKNNEFDRFEELKIGDSFKAIIISMNNFDGLIEVSKLRAEENMLAEKMFKNIRIGSSFTCFITDSNPGGLSSRVGEYEIFIPASQVSIKFVKNLKDYVNKTFQVVALEIDEQNKKIIASIKILEEKDYEEASDRFWKAIFINKIVEGKVVSIMPYGAFINVDGVECLLHISQISHRRINKVEDVLKIGDVLKFRVINLDKQNRKIGLGLKQLETNPLVEKLEKLTIGGEYEGEVIKILSFGAIIRIENGVDGLLHISNATDDQRKNIYEIVKLGDKIKVKVLNINIEQKKLSFTLV